MSAIPPPPREVRKGLLRRHRPWLGLLGGALLAEALILFALLQLFVEQGMPFADYSLDAHAMVTTGRIEAVTGVKAPLSGQELARSTFRFHTGPGRSVGGVSFSAQPPGVAGTEHAVEYLGDDPATCRLAGGRWSPVPPALVLLLVGSFAAGFVLLVIRVRGRLELSIALREGMVTSARVLAVTQSARSGVCVAYQFSDPTGRVHRGRQRLPAGHPLAHLARDADALLPVVHAPDKPAVHWLVAREDFL